MLDNAAAVRSLAEANNVFDSAAVLYEVCEDDRDAGWRFSAIDELLDYEPALRRSLTKQQATATARFREVLEDKQARVDDMCRRREPLCSLAQDSYCDLHDNTSTVPNNHAVAAWLILQAIDQALSTRVPALLRRFRGTEMEPLNTNSECGFGKVYLKLPSSLWAAIPDSVSLPSPDKIDRTASACLEHLAFTTRHRDVLRVVSVDALWDDLSADQIPTCAVVLPHCEDFDRDFPVREKQHRADSGVFWVEAHDDDTYRAQVIGALAEADRQGANILVLPELSASDRLLQAIRDCARGHPFTSLRLIVAGSYHRRRPSGRKDNVCVVLDGFGNMLWEHCKHEAFSYPQASGAGLGTVEYRELIVRRHPQELVITPIGGIAVMICLDFLDDTMLHDLCALGCRWFLVPAWSDGLSGKFETRFSLVGDYGHSAVVVANNPRGVRKPSERHRFYRPVGSSTLCMPQGRTISRQLMVCDLREGL